MDEAEHKTPDFRAPLDVAACIAVCPPDAIVKGLFFRDVLAEVERHAPHPLARGPYVPFKSYPMREFMMVCVEAAARLHPRAPIREALRRLGHAAFPALRVSMVGRVLLGAFAPNIEDVFRQSGRAYSAVSERGGAEVLEVGPGRARIRLWELYNFIDCYHVGIAEGVLLAHGVHGTVRIRSESPVTAEFLVEWRRG